MHCFGMLKSVQIYPEPRFICDKNGIFDYTLNKCTSSSFKENFIFFLENSILPNLIRQKKQIVPNGFSPETFWNSVYPRKYITDLLNKTITGKNRYLESKELIDALFLRGMKKKECAYWIEKTPHTVRKANILHEISPHMRYIHIFRDPKDIYRSVQTLPWGPNNPTEFIPWYNDIITDAIKSKENIPEYNYCMIDLSDLCSQPKELFSKIIHFSGIEATEAEIDTCISVIDQKKANIGKYNKYLDKAEQKIIAKYCDPLYFELKNRRIKQHDSDTRGT